MIKNIFSTQNIGDKIYYFVEWSKENRKPSWITAQACPQILDFLQKNGSAPQVKPEEEKKESQKLSSLPGEITEGQAIFDYLKWRSEQRLAEEKEELGDLQKRLKSEGTPRYNQIMIQKLEAKKSRLNEQYAQKRPKDNHLDFLVDKVEGVQMSRFKKLCFVITVMGRANRYVVPMKLMKKHFPMTLRDYLIDLIQVHHAKDIEEQQALLQKQAQMAAGNPNQAPLPNICPTDGPFIKNVSRNSEMIAEQPMAAQRRQVQDTLMQQEHYNYDEDQIYSGESQDIE